jgi:hypothetical protein
VRVRGAELLTVGVLSTVVLGACGGGGEDRLTKAAFVARVNATCERANMRISAGAEDAFPEKGLVPTPEQLETFVKRTVVPELEREVAEMKRLKPPSEDQTRVDQVIDAGEMAIEEAENLPPTIQTSRGNPLARYAELANSYDLKTCADTADVIRRESSGVRSKNP